MTAKQIEHAHRRLLRAAALLREGKVHPIEGHDKLFAVQSQTDEDRWYLVGKGQTCGCKDKFTLDGRKRCKHTLAALMLVEGLAGGEVGADPFYWKKGKAGKGKEVSRNGRDEPVALGVAGGG